MIFFQHKILSNSKISWLISWEKRFKEMHFDKNGAINLLKMENFVPTHVKTEISRKKIIISRFPRNTKSSGNCQP